MEGIVSERVDLAVKRIGEEIKERGCADVMKWWMFLTTDVIGELTFGESFRMLDIGKVGCICFVSSTLHCSEANRDEAEPVRR
jgi:hypothetical protein